jgi:hypothetical protein
MNIFKMPLSIKPNNNHNATEPMAIQDNDTQHYDSGQNRV